MSALWVWVVGMVLLFLLLVLTLVLEHARGERESERYHAEKMERIRARSDM
ncbi:hypothetical protein [Janthinobacterium sp. PSPC3-1]|uniref:hypothetical protein n=1 Tax=Janthinobacterium sp. PSPC3-1 TaxID=2804653 RepID=UPI003CF8AAC1